MDDTLYKILTKIYWTGYPNNYSCNYEKGGVLEFSDSHLSDDEKLYLNNSGWKVNNIACFTHDDTIKRYQAVMQHPNLTLEKTLNAFVAGMASFPRGRQPIMSYLFGRSLTLHPHKGNSSACRYCAIENEVWENISFMIFFFLYIGTAWNEDKVDMLIDLEEFVTLPEIIPTKEDIEMFRNLITLIANAPDGETVSKLEKRIKQAKTLKEKDKYRLRGILMALADMRVMPNRYMPAIYDSYTSLEERCNITTTQPIRSDIILPLSGWRGELGIDKQRVNDLFANIVSKVE